MRTEKPSSVSQKKGTLLVPVRTGEIAIMAAGSSIKTMERVAMIWNLENPPVLTTTRNAYLYSQFSK
jgi:hypothetical protein